MPRKKKNSKETNINLYYMNNGQTSNELMNDNEKKKAKEREKRIKQNKQKEEKDNFDIETETVIQMTNRNKIKKEEENRKKITKAEQKRRKKIKKIKFIIKIVLLIGIIVGSIIFAMTSPMFNIKNIEVTNNNKVASDEIISLSNLKTGENIFRFRSSNAIKNIKENSYIENVKIKRKIPNIIQIEVEERVAKFSINIMEKYAYITSQGYILEIAETTENLPIIIGISTEEKNIEPWKRLDNKDLEKLEDVLKIMDVVKENNLNDKVTSIDITDKNEYILYLQDELKKVYLGDSSSLSNKMLYVLAIIEQEKGKEGSIYVNGDLNSKFQPYFREKV